MTTGLPLDRLSAGVGRICAPVSLSFPAYLIAVMGGWKRARGVLPAAAACGIAFAGTQFLVSNFIGPELTDILSSLAAMGCAADRDPACTRQRRSQHEHTRPARSRWPGRRTRCWWSSCCSGGTSRSRSARSARYSGELALAAQHDPAHAAGGRQARAICGGVHFHLAFGFRHGVPVRGDPGRGCRGPEARRVSEGPRRDGAAAGDGGIDAGHRAGAGDADELLRLHGDAGLAFAATGLVFPFFSALLGWLGVSSPAAILRANALFGTLQVVTAEKLGMSPVLMAAANSAGGVMGKMISLTSIAVAARRRR